MQQLVDGVWLFEGPFKIIGAEFGVRMTVVRMANGGLWVHSPVTLVAPHLAQFEELGAVEHVVAPNLFHQVYLSDYIRRYPRAQLYGAPGFKEARPDVRLEILTGEPPETWGDTFEQIVLKGMPKMNEVVFFHRASKTLMATDLVFNYGSEACGWTKAFRLMTGTHNGIRASRVFRSLVKDKVALRNAIDRMLQWDFDRVVISHGQIIESNGRQRIEEAFAWLQ